MAFEFDIGSFRGRPNYLMRSKKGFCWYVGSVVSLRDKF